MAKVKVYNDNIHVPVWKEMFKGELVEIPHGKAIEMEFFEAIEFKGQYLAPKYRADETQDPASFKMIRVERPSEEELEAEQEAMGYKCNACKKSYPTVQKLAMHSEVEHGDLVIEDPAAEKEIMIKARKKPGPKPQQKEVTE